MPTLHESLRFISDPAVVPCRKTAWRAQHGVYHTRMRTALTADWIMPAGGAEKVLCALTEAFPGAPLYTTVAADLSAGALAKADIRPSRLQRLYGILGNHQVLLPWMPRAMESFDLSAYDVIVSSSHAVGKGILPPSHALHVCYCHTPMRYAWFMEESYFKDFGIPRIVWPLAKHILKKLRAWDLSTAKRTDLFLANSQTTAKRIRDIYDRESIVVHPPVEDRYFATPLIETPQENYFLAVGRFVPYKRFDLLIEAANAAGFTLKLAGSGQEEQRLRAMAGPTVEFLGRVEDEALPALYAGAEALLFPQEEDAGLVLLEAQACGTPVVAYGKGGALDLTQEGVSSILFPSQTVPDLLAAIERVRSHAWDRAAIRHTVEESRHSAFCARVRAIVLEELERFRSGSYVRR